MSLYDYQQSRLLSGEDHPFAALIMAAMRQADGPNLVKLQAAWPGVFAELDARYSSRGGLLPGETVP